MSNLFLQIAPPSEASIISDYVRANEGIKWDIEPDVKGHPTIGRGHKIKKGEDFSYLSSLSRQEKETEFDRIFNLDIISHTNTAKNLFPQFDNYPTDIKKALVDGTFRGDHKAEFETTKAINRSDWKNVPKNYIDRDDYRDSKASATAEKPWTGVYKRLDRNNKIFKKYAGPDRLIDKGTKDFMSGKNKPNERSSFTSSLFPTAHAAETTPHPQENAFLSIPSPSGGPLPDTDGLDPEGQPINAFAGIKPKPLTEKVTLMDRFRGMVGKVGEAFEPVTVTKKESNLEQWIREGFPLEVSGEPPQNVKRTIPKGLYDVIKRIQAYDKLPSGEKLGGGYVNEPIPLYGDVTTTQFTEDLKLAGMVALVASMGVQEFQNFLQRVRHPLAQEWVSKFGYKLTPEKVMELYKKATRGVDPLTSVEKKIWNDINNSGMLKDAIQKGVKAPWFSIGKAHPIGAFTPTPPPPKPPQLPITGPKIAGKPITPKVTPITPKVPISKPQLINKPIVESNLIQEAKKFKTAEEFVKKLQEANVGEIVKSIPVNEIAKSDFYKSELAKAQKDIKEGTARAISKEPIRLYFEPETGKFSMVDGYHRLADALGKGKTTIKSSIETHANKQQLTAIWKQAQFYREAIESATKTGGFAKKEPKITIPKGRSILAIVRKAGGIDPTKAASAGYPRSSFKENKLSGILRKGGVALDDFADEMMQSGELIVEEGQNPSDALMEALKTRGTIPAAGGLVHEVPAYVQKAMEKGVTIIKRNTGIRMDEAVTVTDIHGNKVSLTKNHEFTPYVLSNGKVWLHDGKSVVVDKKQIEKLKFSPSTTVLKGFYSTEEEGIETVVKGEPITEEGLKWMKRGNFYKPLSRFDVGEIEYLPSNGKYIFNARGGTRSVHNSLEEAKAEALQTAKNIGYDDTKFAQHLAVKGGENYQETLVTVPYSEKKQAEFLKGERPDADLFFKSPHFEEKNIVVHIRSSDFTTPEGKKVLQIQEIQSDWEKAGREKGFAKKLIEDNIVAIKKGGKETSYWEATTKDGDFLVRNHGGLSKEEFIDYVIAVGNTGKIAFHPLLKQWKELGIKKALQMAVEGGYDYLALSTGEQTADLYNLAKQIEEVQYYYSKADKAGTLKAYDKQSNEVMKQIGVRPEKLADYIGKEPASKITKQLGEEGDYLNIVLSNQDLKVGGEWAKILYDKQFPGILKKITGAEIEQVPIGRKGLSFNEANFVDEVESFMGVPFGKVSVQKLETANAPQGMINKFKELMFPAMRKGQQKTQPAIKITPTVRGKVIAQPMAGGLPVKGKPKEMENFDNFESKRETLAIIDRQIAKINGLRLSGKLSAQEANKQVQALNKEKMEYAKENGIAITKTISGKTRIAIRKSGFFAKKEIEDAPIRDVYSQFQSPGGMSLMQDNYKKGDPFGMIYKEVWLPTKKSIASSAEVKNKFDTQFKAILKKYRFPATKKNGEYLSDMLEKKVEISKKYEGMVKDIRAFMDDKRDQANVVREAMGKSKIGYIENYVPHLQKTSIWNVLVGDDMTITDNFDFIIPNQVRNPFAFRRLLKEMANPDRNFFALVERYNSAIAKDIHINPAIENIKAYNIVLKDREKFKAAKYWDEYIRTGLLGKQHKFDSALSVSPLERRGLKKWKDILNKAFLTGKISWNIATQPLSFISLTPVEAGFKNTAVAVLKMFNRGIRKSVRDHSLSLKIKSKDILSDAIGEGRGYANRIYRTKIDKWNDMLSIISSVEEQLLHQASYIAGLDEAKRLGYTGDDAHIFADLVAERSQSMYNKENRSLILSSDVLTAAIPFQSFAVEMSNHAKEVLTKNKGAMQLGIRQRIGKLLRLLIGIWFANQYARAITGREKTTLGTFVPFAGEAVDRSIIGLKNLVRAKRGEKQEYVSDRSLISVAQQLNNLIKASKDYVKYGDIKRLRKIGITFGPAIIGAGGGGQMSNLVEGMIANINEEAKSASGRRLFKIEDLPSKIKAPIFGIWSTKGGREYWEKRTGKRYESPTTRRRP